MLYIDLGTHDPLLPTQLTDQSLVLGAPLWASHGWRLGAIAGAGYAGNSPFGDTRAIYGMGHLQLMRTLSAHESLYITLDYNGHGALLPDVPLPGFGWQYHSHALSGLAGFPTDSLQWRPLPRWRLNASYNVPIDGSAMLRYRVVHGLYAFGDFQNYLEGFQLNAYPDNTRLFMQFSRLEAGLRVVLRARDDYASLSKPEIEWDHPWLPTRLDPLPGQGRLRLPGDLRRRRGGCRGGRGKRVVADGVGAG